MLKIKLLFCLAGFVLAIFTAQAGAADTVPPEAVTDLSCDHIGCVEGEVRLLWTAPHEDGTSGGQVQAYIIKYAAHPYSVDFIGSADDWWAAEAVTKQVLNPPAPSNPGIKDSVIVTGLTAGTTYYFGIKSRDEVPLTSAIDTKAATAGMQAKLYPQIDVTSPISVTTLSGLTGQSSGEIVLSWIAPGDDGTKKDIAGGWYGIKYSTSASFNWGGPQGFSVQLPTNAVCGSKQQRVMKNLKGNATYYFRLWTADERMNWSPVSSGATAWTLFDPASPSAITDLSSQTVLDMEGAVRLSWTAPGDDGTGGDIVNGYYGIKYSTLPGFEWGGPSEFDVLWLTSTVCGTRQTKLIENLIGGLTYYFRVWAGDEEPNWSSFSNKTTSWAHIDTFVPAAVTNLSAQTHPEEEGKVNLSWTAPRENGETGGKVQSYLIRYAPAPYSVDFMGSPDDWWAAEAVTKQVANPPSPSNPGTAEFFTVSGLNYGTTYYFAIKSRDEVPYTSAMDTKASTAGQQAKAWTRADLTSPSAVSDLKAYTGGNAGDIRLSWTSPGDDGTKKNITGGKYGIKYSSDAINWGGPSGFNIQFTTFCAAGSEQSFTVTGLIQGSTYYFRLWTADEVPNWSSISNGATAWAQKDVTPPSQVTGLSAETGTYPEQILLSWISAGDDGSEGEITDGKYRLIYTTDSSDTYLTAPYDIVWSTSTLPATLESKPMTGLEGGTTYYFWIMTADEVPNWSAVSSRVEAFPKPDAMAPAAVTDLTAVPGDMEGEVKLSWTAPHEDGNGGGKAQSYRVRYYLLSTALPIGAVNWWDDLSYDIAGEPVPAEPGTNQAMIIKGLTSGTTYYFAIKSEDDRNNISDIDTNAASMSAAVQAHAWAQVDKIAPSAITDLAAVPGDIEGKITLTWTSPGDNGTTGQIYDGEYVIGYTTVSAHTWDTVSYKLTWTSTTLSGKAQARTITGLGPGTTYYFWIRTCDEVSNWSLLSNRATSWAQTDVTPPYGVDDLSALKGVNEGEIDLFWTSPGDDGTDNAISGGQYGIKWSTCALFDWDGPQDFALAITTSIPSGAKEKRTISALSPGVTYYFKLWTGDEKTNWSAVSNIASAVARRDPVSPAPVTDLFAVKGAMEGEINLFWTSTGDNGMEGDITDGWFRIKHATYPSYSWNCADFDVELSTDTGPGERNFRKIAGLTGGVTYYFKIWLGDELPNWSSVSNTATAWAQVDVTAPAPVTNLTAVPGQVEGDIDLFWTSTGDDGMNNSISGGKYGLKLSADAYYEWDGPSGFNVEWTTATLPGKLQKKTVRNLSAGTTYYFRLWTRDENLNWSSISNGATKWAQGDVTPPAPVTDLFACEGRDHTWIDLSWTAPKEDGTYGGRVERFCARLSQISDEVVGADYWWNPAKGVSQDINGLPQPGQPGTRHSITITGLAPGATYWFAVKSEDEKGNVSAMDTKAATQNGSIQAHSRAMLDGIAPSSVCEISAVPGMTEGMIDFAWTSPGDDGMLNDIYGGKFRIQYSENPSTVWNKDNYNFNISTVTAPGNKNYMTLTGLSAGVTYYFRVWTADEVPNWSAVSKGVTTYAQADVTAPAPVTDLWGYTGSEVGQLHLAWTGRGDDGTKMIDITGGKYRVRYSLNPNATWSVENYDVEWSTDIVPGSFQTRLISGLSQGGTYYLKLWTSDENGNWSSASNAACVRAREIIEIMDIHDNEKDIVSGAMNLSGKFGTTQSGVCVMENKGNVNLLDIRFTSTDLTDGKGHKIPSSSVRFDVNSSTYVAVLPYQTGSDTVSVAVSVSIPGNQIPELYSATVTARSGNGNAADTFFLKLTVIRPDLVVETLSYQPASPEPGTAVAVKIVVRNQGNEDAVSSFWTDLYRNISFAPVCGLVGDECFSCPYLAAGSSITFISTFTYRGGDASLYAMADSDGQIDEKHENNNISGPVNISHVKGYGSANGRVLREIDGSPVVRAYVRSFRNTELVNTVMTDARGDYSINLSPDIYDLRVWAVGCATKTIAGLEIIKNQTTSNLNFSLTLSSAERGLVSGRVTKADTASPVPVARVNLLQHGTTNTIDSAGVEVDGSYTLIVSSGIYDLKAGAAGYLTAVSTGVAVFASNTAKSDFVLSLSSCQPACVESLTACSMQDMRVELRWLAFSSPDIDFYRIYYASGDMDYSRLFAAAADTVPAGTSSWVSPRLERGDVYNFSVRAVNTSGIENAGTSAIVSAKVTGLSLGVKAGIMTPQPGKAVSGNFVTLIAELVQGSAADLSSVMFEYKRCDGSEWSGVPVPAGDTAGTNPDTVYPYFVHWNTDGLDNTDYDVRAVAFDGNCLPDQSPSGIKVSINGASFDVEEKIENDIYVKRQKLIDWKDNTVLIGEKDGNKLTSISIPAHSLDVSEAFIKVTVNPSPIPAVPLRLGPLDEYREIVLENGIDTLKNGNRAVISVRYTDGNNIPEDRIGVYYYDRALQDWQEVETEVNSIDNTVTALAGHFSLFGLFYPSQAPDYKSLMVYPNPYKDRHFNAAVKGITFENLTENTDVRIYNIAGDLVWKAEDIDDNEVLWEVCNESAKPVASGVYIYVITNDANGRVKGKVAVIR